MRRAKIVCTLGPAVSTPEGIRQLVDAGMDVARLNLSHGEYADHEKIYQEIRRASDETGHAVGVLVDLQGPKIRTARFKDGPVDLVNGAEFTITTRDVEGSVTEVGTTYKGLPGDVRPGDLLLIDDGKVCLQATDVSETDVKCVVTVGGTVSNNKGINLPGVAVSVPALSEKDKEDLRWALGLRADMIALSFVRSAADLDDVHAVMDEVGVRLPVIAKIEKPQAVDNLVEIIEAFDGVMVARGDLGVELPLEEVPIVQKEAIEIARRNAKPVIVATQVLESMIENPRPTRAEASDAANAVLDGADALMLSGETSVGAYPILAVQTMARIIESTEEHGLERIRPLGTKPHTMGGAVAAAAVEIGELLGAKYLITFSQSGDTAKRMSRIRPRIPMLAFTPEPHTRSRLALAWGIETYLVPMARHTDQMAQQVDKSLLASGRAQEGDLVVIVAGSPPGIPGSTNALRVHKMGDAINKVAPAYEDLAD
ncbi:MULTISPECIES: pyruvate kinase [unclassified Phycicoccus]|uniref:pyruvate kinase n=1 Tax=unclassified Phycicoccus TaxID=2637926 RepID=UPI000702E16C|nr:MULTISPECIES: pyruvate kinase [unclassified Phycicoccus]KRF22560.1 pyruvate kinase [Phycicoccus sp. Soil802]KRF24758.1 pyruvate kinase [Phycicoccus sp. Soil803]